MTQDLLSRAILEAFKDPKVINSFAASVSKKVIEQKLKPNSDEDIYVRNHIIFAEPGDVDGTWMIAKEIEEAVLAINPDFEIKTRTFGKALLTEAKETKATNKGRAYFIKAIVSDIKEYAENLPVASAKNVSEEVAEEVADVKKDKKSKKDKKDKKSKGSDVVKEVIEAAEELPKIEPKDAFDKPEVNVGLLIEAVNGYDSLDDLKEHLSSMSETKLIKFINKHQMPIITSDADEDELVNRIISLIEAHLPKEKAAEEVVEEVAEEVEKPKKDKKNKKDKKKDKKSKDSDAFAEIGKKDKKKKKKNKDK